MSVTSSLIGWAISGAGTHVGTLPQIHIPASQEPHPDTDGPGSWSGIGGRIVAACNEDGVSLRSAVPNDGYVVEIKDRGREQLRIDFARSDKSGEQRVVVTCGTNGPVYDVA